MPILPGRAAREFPIDGVTLQPDAEHALMAAARRFNYYDRAARSNRWWYLGLRIGQALVAAAVTVVGAYLGTTPAASASPGMLVASLGALTLLLETLLQLFRFHSHYLSRRRAAEEIRAEVDLFLAGAGPYARTDAPAKLLTTRTIAIGKTESATWLTAMQKEVSVTGASKETDDQGKDGPAITPDPRPAPSPAQPPSAGAPGGSNLPSSGGIRRRLQKLFSRSVGS